MKRVVGLPILAAVVSWVALAALPVSTARAQAPAAAVVQAAPAPRARARIQDHAYRLRVESAPGQAVVYWDAGPAPAPRDYGIAGYTPLTLVVPRGPIHVIVELKGFRTEERDVDVAKPETLLVTMEKAAQPAHLELAAGGDGTSGGADVSLDGVARGTLPTSFEVPAGRHNLEVKKTGWKTLTRWIELAEDERRTIEVALERIEVASGTLLVTADAPGEVYVDGTRRDVAPAVITGLSPGDHVVEVRGEGATPWRQSVTIASGQQTKVAANLALVEIDRAKADVLVQSPVPVAASPEPPAPPPAPPAPPPAPTAPPSPPSAEETAKRKASMSSFGARVLPAGGFTADIATGYPYILFARLTVGLFSKQGRGGDLGVELQSFFQMWTGAVHGRLQLLEVGPLSLGVRANTGVGIGTDSRNTIFGDVAGIASLDFAGVVSLSADLRLSLWSDQFCPNMSDVTNHGVGQADYCKAGAFSDAVKYPEFGGKDPGGRRFSGSRLYMGLTLAAAIDSRTSFFARLEFLPGAEIFTFPAERMAFEDKYNSIMFEHDPLYYGTVGLSWKY